MPTIKQAFNLGARHGREDVTRHASTEQGYDELKRDFRLHGKHAFALHMKRYVSESEKCKALKLAPELVQAYCDGYVEHAIERLELIILRKDN